MQILLKKNNKTHKAWKQPPADSEPTVSPAHLDCRSAHPDLWLWCSLMSRSPRLRWMGETQRRRRRKGPYGERRRPVRSLARGCWRTCHWIHYRVASHRRPTHPPEGNGRSRSDVFVAVAKWEQKTWNLNVGAHFLPRKAPFFPPAETTTNIQFYRI